MPTPEDCPENTDPLKLVREGTSQDQRLPAALDPAHAPVNERSVAQNMVFAKGYGALLNYFNEQNVATKDWTPFFSTDVSVHLATIAIEDVDAYMANTKAWFEYLNELANAANEPRLKDTLGFLFSSIAT